ncbi:MAG: pirin family protein [Rhodospirillaceae bacterium]
MIDLIIRPREHDIGGLIVRRVLPFRERRSVGPFVFFDHFGPAVFPAGEGLDVRPHPHIGLATITYLYDGVIQHRDSLGNDQPIRPGEVNWMTAGRGIVHSERTPEDERARDSGIFGLQAWAALPVAEAEAEPSFVHFPASDLPEWAADGFRIRLIAGKLLGHESPVKTFSELFYADLRLAPGGSFVLPPDHAERAVHNAEGRVTVGGETLTQGEMAVLRPGSDTPLEADPGGEAKVILLGGAALDGARTIWWNFVSHSAERIQQAKDDWKNGRFAPVPGDAEFIPLPD